MGLHCKSFLGVCCKGGSLPGNCSSLKVLVAWHKVWACIAEVVRVFFCRVGTLPLSNRVLFVVWAWEFEDKGVVIV